MQLSSRKDMDVSIPVDPGVAGLQRDLSYGNFSITVQGLFKPRLKKGIFVRMECRSKVQVLNMSIVNL